MYSTSFVRHLPAHWAADFRGARLLPCFDAAAPMAGMLQHIVWRPRDRWRSAYTHSAQVKMTGSFLSCSHFRASFSTSGYENNSLSCFTYSVVETPFFHQATFDASPYAPLLHLIDRNKLRDFEMPFFFCCSQRRQAGPVSVRAGPSRPPHKNDYVSSNGSYRTMPVTPPPPYEAEYSFGQPPRPSAFYQQQFDSQQQLPQTQPNLRKKTPAWASTAELSRPQNGRASQQKQGWQSTTDLASRPTSRPPNECAITRSMNRAAAMCDVVATRLHDVLGRSDSEETEANNVEDMIQALSLEDTGYHRVPDASNSASRTKPVQTGSRAGIINIQKSWMYANSRLPPYMVPFKVYVPTWQLFCKAASASAAVYKRPTRGEREDYVEANWRQGTKAMVLKSTPLDESNVIVIAIRGSQWNAIDWAVNFTIEPTEPTGFLDDTGNACHEGFLQVARSMIVPVAERLRQLLEQDPSRSASSLLFTGHSAGGAVATLLYMHMLSRTVSSRLTDLNGIFKRIHCVTFGVPPISLLPLQKPSTKNKEQQKAQFVSFVNEGDPIVRADFQYVKSLVRLYATSAPKAATPTGHGLRSKISRQNVKISDDARLTKHPVPPRWPVPDATLSNAGRLVLLRQTPGKRDSVEHVYVSDGQLRDVVFGDPVMHHMDVYQERVRSLAVNAVTGEEA